MWESMLFLLRWAGRIAGLTLFGFVLMFVIGHGGLPNILPEPPAVRIEFVALMVMVVGSLVGWCSERWGAALVLGGFVTFSLTEFAANGRLPGGAIPYLAIPGLLYLLSACLHHFSGKKTTATA